MNETTPTPTADQIAAFQRLDKILGNADQPFADENWAEVRKFLPDALTNPQPALPTEPGWYLDSEGDVWRLKVDQWWRLFDGEPYAAAFAPFTRLVPERPQVTREQVVNAITENNPYGAVDFENDIAARILALVNGTHA